MINENELFAELAAADQAGDTQHAKMIADVINQQRDVFVQQMGLKSRNMVDDMGIDGVLKFAGKDEKEWSPVDGMSNHDKFRTAIGRGFADVGQGVMQLGMERYDDAAQAANPNHERLSDDYTKEKTAELKDYQKLSEDSPYLTGAGRLVGNIAGTPLPAAGGANALSRIAGAAALNASAAGLEFVPEGGSREQNMAIGGALGGGMQGLIGEPLGRIANKTINASKKNLDLPDEVQDVVRFADDNKLPLYYDDIKQDGIAQKIGQQIDEVPIIGGSKSRQLQNEKAKEAAEALKDKFLPDGQIDDLYTEVSQSAKRQLDKFKTNASNKYTESFQELNKSGEFDLPQARQKITEILQNEASLGSMAESGISKHLKAVLEVPNGNFEHWHKVRSRILTTVRDAKKGVNSNVGSDTTRALEEVAKHIDESMDVAAKKIGGKGANQWRQANKYYHDNVVQYKKGALHQAMNENNPEKMLDMLIGVGGGTGKDSSDIAMKLYKGLDQKGRDMAKYGMMEKSFNDALQETGVFSPAKFASRLERYNKRLGVFMKPEDKAYIDGLSKYMRYAQNSGSFAANVPTGQKAVGTLYALAAGAGAMTNFGGTAMGAGGMIGLKKLFRTERGRSFLLALSKTTKDSKHAHDLITKINQYLSRGASLANAQPEVQ